MMKTDIETAIENLAGHTLSLCYGGDVITSNKKGISPMLDIISSGTDLRGYCVADIIVGKAVAILFVKAGIKEVYATTISRRAAEFLKKHGIPFTYRNMTENIINRVGNDICPMEKAVLNTDDIEQGLLLIKAKYDELVKLRQ